MDFDFVQFEADQQRAARLAAQQAVDELERQGVVARNIAKGIDNYKIKKASDVQVSVVENCVTLEKPYGRKAKITVRGHNNFEIAVDPKPTGPGSPPAEAASEVMDKRAMMIKALEFMQPG